jgi:2-haloacid dehalogenase
VTRPTIEAVVFDLGGVVIDWNPRYLYRRLFRGDDAAMERFLAEVVTPEWNLQQDAGRPWAEAIELLAREHPDQQKLIRAYHERWPETLGGSIDESVAVLAELRDRPVRLFALTNWSAETFPTALERYEFLAWFEAIVVSGEVGLVKPDPGIFRHLIERNRLEPGSTVFVDDSPANVEAARAQGLVGLLFESPIQLRRDLVALGVLPSGAGASSRPGSREPRSGRADR